MFDRDAAAFYMTILCKSASKSILEAHGDGSGCSSPAPNGADQGHGERLDDAEHLAAPAVDKGAWNFSGPLTQEKPAALVPLDPRYFSDQPVVVTEGRLLLLNEE